VPTPRRIGIAVYVRVSHKSQDLASQEGELERWAKGQDEPVSWFRDKFTGTSMDRPGFEKLMKAVRAGEVTSVCVWRLDRLGRTTAGLATLFDELRQRRVNLVSIRDGLDLSTPAGRLMASVLASVAVYENEVRKERQLVGIANAKEKGVRFGPEPGTRKGKRITVTAEQEQAIRRMKAEGEKVAAIARATGLSRPTVYSVLDTEEQGGSR
jgi:DNA invertase Pin-like site-specific DNA recombinase